MKICFARIAVVLLATASSTPAWAQAAAPDPGQAAQVPASLEDIVVTARRREEALQDVPVSITALSGDALTQRGVGSTEALRQVAPALNIFQNNRSEAGFYIRGQGPGIVGGGGRNFTSVATYFAEVPTTIAGSGVFYDLANVQVLKGPQGTLFGRNTTGGAVLFEPNRPDWDLGGHVKFSLGNHGYHEAEGVLNLPVVDDVLALRLAGSVSRRNGFTRSINTGQRLDSRNHDAFRVSLLFTPVPGVENITIVDRNLRDNSGNGLILRQVNPGAQLGALPNPLPADVVEALGLPEVYPLLVGAPTPIACTAVALPDCPAGGALGAFIAAANGGFSLTGLTPQQFADALALQNSSGVRRTLTGQRLYARNKDFGITNKTVAELSDTITLKNIFSFRRQRIAEVNDIAPGLGYAYSEYPGTGSHPPYIRGSEQYTEELQLQGKLQSIGVDYVLGFYHERSKPGFAQSYRSVALGQTTNTANDYDDRSTAVFAHLEWQITDAFQLSGGVRYTWDRRYASASVTDDFGTCTQVNTATGLIECPVEGKARFKAPTYDITAQYEIGDGVLAYAAYRRGYKSGGFNLPSPTAELATFGKETVDDFELGLKADWDIGFPLRTNLSAFVDKYKGIQISLPVLANGTFISLVQNAGKATNKGFEAEFTLVPAPEFTLSGFASYLDAKCATDVGTACRVGRQIAFQPHWKFGVNGQYVLFDGDKGALTLSSDVSYSGKVTTSDPDAVIDTYPGYALWNARIDWANILNSKIDLSLFATNITGEKYIVGGYPLSSALGFDAALYGEPRMFGMSLTYRFGG